MDIDQLTKIISDIILTRDEVTLPGLGSFVAEEVASSFSDKGFTINPPYRKLSFRPYLGGDNFIAEAFAKEEGMGIEEATACVTDFLGKLKEVLKQRKSIVFPGLGHLRATKENNFFFVSDENIHIYPEGFGLHSVSLKSRRKEPVEAEKRAQAEAISRLQQQAVMPEIKTAHSSSEETTVPETAVATTVPACPVTETVPAPAHKVAREPMTKFPSREVSAEEPRKKKHIFLKIILALVILAALIVAALFLMAEFTPELLDKLLYSEEELRILYY